MKFLSTGSIELFAPVERVFQIVTDIDKWPAWVAGVVSAQQPDHRPLAVEEEYLLCMHAGRKRWHETFEITKLVRNAFLSLEGDLSTARRIDFRLEQRSAHTRVALSVGYPVFGGVLGAFRALLGKRRLRRLVSETLVHLKHRVEDRGESDYHALSDANIVPLPSHLRVKPARQPVGVA